MFHQLRSQDNIKGVAFEWYLHRIADYVRQSAILDLGPVQADIGTYRLREDWFITPRSTTYIQHHPMHMGLHFAHDWLDINDPNMAGKEPAILKIPFQV